MVWFEDGRRHRHSLGTLDRASAEAAARSFWQRRTLGGRVHTVGEAVDLYIKAKSDMASIRNVKSSWKVASDYWRAMPIARVDVETSVEYRKRRSGVRAITVRNELAIIRSALNWAEKHKMVVKAPFIQMPPLPASTVGHITKPQFRQLLDAAVSPHIKLFMMLAVGTGARSNALLDLTWDRVDFGTGLIVLNPIERVQTSKYRATVPMNAQLREALVDAKTGALSEFVVEHGREQIASVKKGFGSTAKRAGIKVSPHMLRHSAAVWMAEAGIPMPQIARFLGHTDSRITERVYAKFSPDFLKGAAEALTW
ncbi:tyrosine-type recombinase/integrase [Sphingomonas sp. HMP6]|uniref:tyrosine-type recombinase/integrase n=1 Tax=Sphingomonas sp. HMP6 TaxID=1517551 RepID=UPI003FA7E871